MKIPAGLARHALKLEKNSPTILFGAGVIGSVASTVLACRATLKMSDVLDRIEADKSATQVAFATVNNPEYDGEQTYTDDERRKDLVVITVRGIGSVVGLYAPAVVVGGLSIAALTKSHNILNDRITALSAAYTAIDKAYTEYRARVVEKYGEDQDQQFRFPREKTKETNPDTGREHTIEVVGKNLDASPYAKFFDPLSPSWCKDPEYNLTFLKCQQDWANDKLRMRGHVFLNEIYDAIGVPRTKAGSIVGWTVGKDGDNYIDFGIFDAEDAVKRAFVNGYEGAILLDFNVDGVIYDKIDDVEQDVWHERT